MRGSMVSGAVAGKSARVRPVHLEFGTEPAAAQVTFSVPVSVTDLVAVLFSWSASAPTLPHGMRGMPVECLTDPAEMSRLILEGLLCRYRDFYAARRVVEQARPGSAEWELITALRTAVIEHYTDLVPMPRYEADALAGVPS